MPRSKRNRSRRGSPSGNHATKTEEMWTTMIETLSKTGHETGRGVKRRASSYILLAN